MRPDRDFFKELYESCYRLRTSMEDYEIYLETIDEEGAYILINNNDTFFCYESLKQNALTFIQNIDKLKALIDRKD